MHCNSAAQRGFACTAYPHVPLLSTSQYVTTTSKSDASSSLNNLSGGNTIQEGRGELVMSLGLGSHARRQLEITPGLERLQISVAGPSVASSQLYDLCTNAGLLNISEACTRATLRLKAKLYSDQKPESDFITYSEISLNFSEICGKVNTSCQLNFDVLSYDFIKPLPGYWTLHFSLYLLNPSDSTLLTPSSLLFLKNNSLLSSDTQKESLNPDKSRALKSNHIGVLMQRKECRFGNASNFVSKLKKILAQEKKTTKDHCLLKTTRMSFTNFQSSDFNIKINETNTNDASLYSQIDKFNLNFTLSTLATFCPPGYSSDLSGVSPFNNCLMEMHTLDTYSSQESATFQYVLQSGDIFFTAPAPFSSVSSSNAAQHQLLVLCRGSLESMAFSPVGGSMRITVRVTRPTISSNSGSEGNEERHGTTASNSHADVDIGFDVYVSVGNIPHSMENDSDTNADLLTNAQLVLSPNLFHLKSSLAETIDKIDSPSDWGARFQWVRHKPKISEVVRHQEGDYHIYCLVVFNEATTLFVRSTQAQYKLDVQVVFSPCLESTCKHGVCMISDDGMRVSSCSCRYESILCLGRCLYMFVYGNVCLSLSK